MPTSKQQYYNKTITHLRNQSQQSIVAEQSTCALRTPDGNRCAIGIHIPDGHPALAADYGSLNYLEDNHHDLAGTAWPAGWDGYHLAGQLQELHDNVDMRTHTTGGLSPRGERKAKALAQYFGLKYTPPTTGDTQ